MGNLKSTIPQSIPNKLSSFSFINQALNNPNPNKIPKQVSQIEKDIKSLNKLFRYCRQILNMELKFEQNGLGNVQKINQKSIVSGFMMDVQKTMKFKVAFSLEQVYELKQIFRNFNFANQIRKSIQRDSSKSDQGNSIKLYKQQQLNSQQKNPTATGDKQNCIICLSQKPQIVLPCAHSFCGECTQKYISQKQYKLCPLCRKQYEMGRETFEKQLYEIIESKVQDEQFNEQFVKMVFGIIEIHNSRQLNKILKKNKMHKSELKEQILQQKVQKVYNNESQ